MPDEITTPEGGTEPVVEITPEPTTAVEPVTVTTPGPTFTQADLDKHLANRLTREREKTAKEQAEKDAELETYRAEKQAAEDANKSDMEKLLERTATAEAAVTAATQAQIASAREAQVARLVAVHAPNLPESFQALITGTTQDEITESIAALQEQGRQQWGAAVAPPPAQKSVGSPSAPAETVVPEQLSEEASRKKNLGSLDAANTIAANPSAHTKEQLAEAMKVIAGQVR